MRLLLSTLVLGLGFFSQAQAKHPTPNQENIDEKVKENLGSIRACYESAEASHPGLKGKVVVHFEIDEGGRAKRVGIASSTLKNEAVEDCVVSEFEKIKFADPGLGRVSVDYPIAFSSSQKPKDKSN